MKHKILTPPILLILLVFSSLIANASEPKTITSLADTYVDALNANSAYGDRDYLEVSDYASGLCIASLMFDLSEVSHVLNASSEKVAALLLLCCFSPRRWCALMRKQHLERRKPNLCFIRRIFQNRT